MKKIGYIAAREFLATVATRGFVIGLLIVPAIVTIAAIVAPRLLAGRDFRVQGQMAIVDPTGAVAPELRTAVDPSSIAARRADETRRALGAAPPVVRELAEGAGSGRAASTMFGPIPALSIVELNGSDLGQAKAWLLGSDSTGAGRRLALAVVHADAITPADGQAGYGTYDLYLPANLDDRIEAVVQQSLREAIVAARARAEHVDRRRMDALLRVDRVPARTVTRDGERRTVGAFNRSLPFAFIGLLVFSILFGGQALITSTVEEKSSRVVEVLLSAVSPLELMAGKILGQMAVSLVALGLYVAMGLALLLAFAMLGLLDITLLAYLLVFFVIAYLLYGSMMVAVGAAVNEMKEAQSLQMPLTLALMLPWVLAQSIARDPNSPLSTVISFVPPVNTFIMLVRMTSSAPPPLWQVWLSIAIGVASVVAAVWFAAKVFRIGLLMHGKPPDFATLVRWARAA